MGASAYMTSKLGMIALSVTNVHAREAARCGKEDVLVNACCPGWCKTDMASDPNAPLTAAHGEEIHLFLSLLPPGSPGGEF